jgi:Pyruvate/2-oxoacid:ferredoxin oxidoreductase gamma subunit
LETSWTDHSTPELVSLSAIRKAVKGSVPAGTEELNLAALERGIEHGLRIATPR